MNNTTTRPSDAPFFNSEFDNIYSSALHWMWTDIRIPKKLKQLIAENKPKTSLELGCGIGNFSTYFAKQGIEATAVDFSSVAIEKAKRQTENLKQKPTFLVGDVTNLANINSKFDVSFDIGCFHCLDKDGQQKYVNEIARLLKIGGTHLIWAINKAPSNIKLSLEYIRNLFGGKFELVYSQTSNRRGFFFIGSHWYVLKKI